MKYHLDQSAKKLITSKRLQWTLLVILIIYQLIRLIAFVNVYGGFDHDSGWFLGIARSLAEKGTYTTMVSSMPDPTVAAGPNIHHQFEIQDKDGGVYFFIEGTSGPTQVIPDAIIIKLFGSGFWQFRTASLLFYLTFLVLGTWLLYVTGGFFASLLFHAFIFFYPHLSVFLGYESLGEVPTMVCVLSAYILCAQATTAKTKQTLWYFLSGLAAGLALTAKLIALLPLTGLAILWLILAFKKRSAIKDAFTIAAGSMLPLFIWELVHLITISRLFGFKNYVQHLNQRYIVFLTEGSGLVTDQTQNQVEFLRDKLLLISEISHPNPLLSLISLIIIAAAGPFLMWRFKNRLFKQNIVILLWGGWLTHTLWFIIASERGAVRHYWQALILGVLLFSLCGGNLLSRARVAPRGPNLWAAIAITILLCANFYSQRQAATFFMSDALVESWYEKHLSLTHIGLPWMIVPRAEQEAALAVLRQLPASARIFYPEAHKSAEMGVLTGRILYPIERRPLMPPAEGDVVLIGPSLISRWRKPAEAPISRVEQQAFIAEVYKQIERECPNFIFKNDYYIICGLD